MMRRRPARITVGQHMHSGIITGPVRVVHPVIVRLGIPYQYDHRRHAWMVPMQRRADIEAALVADGHFVEAFLA
jgi:hypothetical protein